MPKNKKSLPVYKDGELLKKYKEASKDVLNWCGSRVDVSRLKKLEEHLFLKNIVFDISLSANSVADKDGFITDANKSFLRIWGFSNKNDVIGKPISYFLKNKSEARSILSSLNKYDHWQGEYTGKKKDKSVFIAYGTAATIRDIDNRLIGYYSSVIDISERKRMEERTKKEEETLTSILQNTAIGIALYDRHYKLIVGNPWFCHVLGYAQEELKKMTFGEITHPDDLKHSIKNIKKLERGKINSFTIEKRYIRKDGGIIYALTKVSTVKELSGKITSFVVSMEDITEKRREEVLLKKRSFMIENSLEGHAVLDYGRTNYLLYVNKAWEKITGYKSAEVVNKHVSLMVEALNKNPQQNKRFLEALKSFHPFEEEMEWITKSGKKIFVDVASLPLKEDGKVTQWFNTIRDITSKKKAEDQLMASETRFRSLFESSKEAIMTLEPPNWFFTSCNLSMVEIFRAKNQKALISNPPWKISPEYQPDGQLSVVKAKKMIEKAMLEGSNFFEWTHKKLDGQEFPATVLLSKVEEGGKLYLQATVRDITNQKKAEEALKDSEEKYHSVVNDTADLVQMVSADGYMIFTNNSWHKTFKYTEAESLKLNIKQIVDPAFLEHCLTIFSRALTGEKINGIETIFIDKNGQKIFVEGNISPKFSNGKVQYLNCVWHNITESRKNTIRLQEEQNMLEQAESVAGLGSYVFEIQKNHWSSSKELNRIFGINDKYKRTFEDWDRLVHPDEQKIMADYFKNEVVGKRKNFDKEYRIIRQSDKSVRIVHGLGRLEFDKENNLIRMIGTIQDVTDAREKELQLDQVKSDFLSLGAHQLRTPLSAIKWVLETLTHSENFTEKQKEKMNDLVISNERLINLVNDFLDVTKIEAGKLIVDKKTVDLKELIIKVIENYEILAKEKNKKIKTVFLGGLVNVYCDPVLISEALANLLSNALYYSPEESDSVTIKVSEESLGYVISVHNSGCIDHTAAKKIREFGKFARGSKAVIMQPSGSGLGLYIAKKMIEANGGAIWFESNTKSGTTFYLKINKDEEKK